VAAFQNHKEDNNMTHIKETISSYLGEYKTLIKNKDFVRLILAGIVSNFGSKISYFALLRKVYIISGGKITDIGFLTTFELIPTIFFSAFAGIMIDRFSRKKIMILSDVCSGLTILAALFINDLKLIYLITFIKATVNVFRRPAQSAMEPNMVNEEDIPLLNSFKSSSNSLVQIIGSAIGAATVGFLGLERAFIIDAFTFWASGAIIMTLKLQEKHLDKEYVKQNVSAHFGEFKEGVSIMWSNSKIRLMVLIETFLTFTMVMQGTLIYIFIRETLNMGDKSELAWGTLLSAIGVGTIIGSFIIGVKVKNYANPFKLFLNVLVLDSIALGLFVFNKWFPLSIALFVILGCIGAAHMIILNTVLQKTVPDENRGKVFSVIAMINGPAGVLSILIGTAAATVITAQYVLLSAAIMEAMIAIGVRFTKTFKSVDADVNNTSLNNDNDKNLMDSAAIDS